MIKGIGTDIIEVKRIETAITRTPRFLEKIYTDNEQLYYTSKQKKIETLAGLFAAKEAVSKAMGTGFRSFSPCDIEVIPNELGKPEVTLLNAAKEMAIALGIVKVHITISHCRSYATAYAIAEGNDMNETNAI